MSDAGFIERRDRAARRIGKQNQPFVIRGRAVALDDDRNLRKAFCFPAFKSLEPIDDFIKISHRHHSNRHGAQLFRIHAPIASIGRIRRFQLLDREIAKVVSAGLGNCLGVFFGLFLLHSVTPDLPPMVAARFPEDMRFDEPPSPQDAGIGMASLFQRESAEPDIAARFCYQNAKLRWPKVKNPLLRTCEREELPPASGDPEALLMAEELGVSPSAWRAERQGH